MQEEQIELLKDSDELKLLVEIYLSELSRVRYLLRAYLRCRLQKIERHVMHILDNAGAWAARCLTGPAGLQPGEQQEPGRLAMACAQAEPARACRQRGTTAQPGPARLATRADLRARRAQLQNALPPSSALCCRCPPVDCHA